MNTQQKKMQDYLRQDPDRNYMNEYEDLYYCRSCLGTKVFIAITGFIYCGKCNKMLDHFHNVSKMVRSL